MGGSRTRKDKGVSAERFFIGWHDLRDHDGDDIEYEGTGFVNLSVAIQHAKGVALHNQRMRVFVLDDEAVAFENVIRWESDQP